MSVVGVKRTRNPAVAEVNSQIAALQEALPTLAWKQPPSAFLLFSSAKRRELAAQAKENNEKLKPQQATKQISDIWNGLDADARKPWVEKAAEAKKAAIEAKKNLAAEDKKKLEKLESLRKKKRLLKRNAKAGIVASDAASDDESEPAKKKAKTGKPGQAGMHLQNGGFLSVECIKLFQLEKKLRRLEQKFEAMEEVEIPEAAAKLPKGPYILYCAAMRASVKEQFPDLKGGQQLKKVGELWNKLSEEDKAPWAEKARVSKEAYEAAINDLTKEQKKYRDTKLEIHQLQKQVRVARKAALSGKSKRATPSKLNAYNVFMRERTAELKKQGVTKNVFKQAADQWKTLKTDVETMKKYSAIATAENARSAVEFKELQQEAKKHFAATGELVVESSASSTSVSSTAKKGMKAKKAKKAKKQASDSEATEDEAQYRDSGTDSGTDSESDGYEEYSDYDSESDSDASD